MVWPFPQGIQRNLMSLVVYHNLDVIWGVDVGRPWQSMFQDRCTTQSHEPLEHVRQ